MIFIENKRKSEKKLKEKYPDAYIVDVTSKAKTGLVKLSPFYPHGNIPIPFSEGKTAMCVECIWQGLKVFETEDVDTKVFENDKMKNIKRTIRKLGKPKGHRKGINGAELLNYIDARIEIYLPTYLWVLENKVQNIIDRIRKTYKEKDIVFLDYTINENVLDPKKPLSHAFLVKAYIEGKYPTKETLKLKKNPTIHSQINFEYLKSIWFSKSESELSKEVGIKRSIVNIISHLLKNNDDVNIDLFLKTKGIGKITIKKLFYFYNKKMVS